jgi:hypothetical protein
MRLVSVVISRRYGLSMKTTKTSMMSMVSTRPMIWVVSTDLQGT